MEYNKLSGMCGTMINKAGGEIRRTAIIQFMAECKRETLKNYCKSMGISQSGTKLQLARRIYDNANHHTYQIHLPPNGTVSIGIGLSVHPV
jgi:hypothetical protein